VADTWGPDRLREGNWEWNWGSHIWGSTGGGGKAGERRDEVRGHSRKKGGGKRDSKKVHFSPGLSSTKKIDENM